jgi:glyoxylase-like metal-dependent hydrolase (beta-lactamase superfamily II)
MQRLTAGLLLTAVAATANAQNIATKFENTEIVPGIHMIAGADGFGGGNMGLLVGDDFVAMIDDGIEPLAPTLLSHVSELAGRPVNFLINTHVHADHTGSNAHFAGSDSDTVIFAHDNVRSRLALDSNPAGGAAGLPVVTFAESMSFHLGGIDARVMHLPRAHTDGDAVINFPRHNVL